MEIQSRLPAAVRHFWSTRQRQSRSQGREGQRDYGQRTAVTGGKQLDGFVSLLSDLLVESGVAADSVLSSRRIELPGYFGPEKQWDLVLVIDGQLVGAVELKSHIGPSFGNNFNNRTEEAIGTSTDLLTAYRDGAFKPGARPWLGYLMLLEEHPRSLAKRQRYQEPHFAVFPGVPGHLLCRSICDSPHQAAAGRSLRRGMLSHLKSSRRSARGVSRTFRGAVVRELRPAPAGARDRGKADQAVVSVGHR